MYVVTFNKQRETVPCPLCGSDQYQPVRGKDVVRCLACGFVYLRDRPTASWLENYYSNVYAVNQPGAAPPVRRPANLALVETPEFYQARREEFWKEVKEVYGKPVAQCSLIDIGCGWGGFLYTAAKEGAKGIGYEWNVPNVEFGRKFLGLEIRREHFEKANLENEIFDIIVLIHSLEHMSDPLVVLKKAKTILKKGGLLAGIVPNFESFLSEHLLENWAWLERDWHYSHFSRSSLESCAAKAGLVPEKTYSAIGDYGMEEFMRHLPREWDLQRKTTTAKNLEQAGRGEEIRFFFRKPE
jgi:SAM-dependent methyltransferase